MHYLKGTFALTPFRLNRLISHIAEHIDVNTIDAQFYYFVDVESPLSQEEMKQLSTLLKGATFQESLENDDAVFVIPRIGTLSAYSSKATDIARICGLYKIKRIERGIAYKIAPIPNSLEFAKIATLLHDPMTESLVKNADQIAHLFDPQTPQPSLEIDLFENEKEIEKINKTMGLSLNTYELDYLLKSYKKLKRNPTDTELMMFAQVNSEHCRHKVFKANWEVDGQKKPNSLFDMIKHTYKQHPDNVLSAYSDNAAVLKGSNAHYFFNNPQNNTYSYSEEPVHIVLKVETHNHPTAISPFPGAATGSGGEIRDEAATGIGAKAKAGLCAFSTAHLNLQNQKQPWEITNNHPPHMASALNIMLEAPIGAASFNNEFGRPNLCGYFRTLEIITPTEYGDLLKSYYKPIMLAGGVGNIRESHIKKRPIPPKSALLVIGGPALKIGLGGGAASSRTSHSDRQALDFASVQRSNPEMQRRCQEVINTCWALGDHNPILCLHDVGAGGLSNALPELVDSSDRGAQFDLRAIFNAAPGMSPMEIWCNEAQERFVLAIDPESLEQFIDIAKRERCPYAVVGTATHKQHLTLKDDYFKNEPIDLPMQVLFDDLPIPERITKHITYKKNGLDIKNIDINDAIERVLQFPTVSSKAFLITIGDRSVGGFTARDQMVGPWQVPVADAAVTVSDYTHFTGEAMTMGERAPIALIHHAASARMAVGEAITNIVCADIEKMDNISLSANWMAAVDVPGEDAGLYDAVTAIGMELCPALGIAIPVGKDSLSMRAAWEKDGKSHSASSPLSLVITAAGKVHDVRKTLTPQLINDNDTSLLLIDLSKGSNFLGGSVLAQVYNQIGNQPPDLDDPLRLKQFFNAISILRQDNLILAYHDRSDGGLITTILEMMFAGHIGVDLDITTVGKESINALFAEELGAVIQVKNDRLPIIEKAFEQEGLSEYIHFIGQLNQDDTLTINHNDKRIYCKSRFYLQRLWSNVSYQMQRLRDNPDCAETEYDQLLNVEDPGLNPILTFDINDSVSTPFINTGKAPKLAILREQGVNGQLEMAAAFTRAGFECIDVHMSDLLNGKQNLDQFAGLAACGGFSYGDVLGAGYGWAQSILMHDETLLMFEQFFKNPNTFALGVCNGCQMLSHLKSIIPGAENWAQFERNNSEQFEARLSQVKIEPSPSIFFNDMEGSILPITVAHGEGKAVFSNPNQLTQAHIALRYVDNMHNVTIEYPNNPNGSIDGITALTTNDGRVTIMMPHPERVFRNCQLSYKPHDWKGDRSPWMRFFENARVFAG